MCLCCLLVAHWQVVVSDLCAFRNFSCQQLPHPAADVADFESVSGPAAHLLQITWQAAGYGTQVRSMISDLCVYMFYNMGVS